MKSANRKRAIILWVPIRLLFWFHKLVPIDWSKNTKYTYYFYIPIPIQYLNYRILNNVACKLLWTFTHILGIIALQYFFGKKMWLSLKLRVTEKNQGYLVGNIFKQFFI